jgi:hypothetical protein
MKCDPPPVIDLGYKQIAGRISADGASARGPVYCTNRKQHNG